MKDIQVFFTKAVATVQLTKEFLEEHPTRLDSMVEWETGNLLLKVTTRHPTELLETQDYIYQELIPASWWQMFKRDVFKLPFKTKVHEVKLVLKHTAVFPRIVGLPNVRDTEFFRHIRVEEEEVK